MRLWTAARHPRQMLYQRTRRRIARSVIAGQGIEIGALHSPFPVPRNAKVQYVDHLTTDQLRDEYPELAGEPLVPVDIVDDGETLATISDQSQDFVISSHLLEHCEDPIGTLKAQLRVLRPGGTLLLALPDRRYGIDRNRAATTFDHIVADHEQGASVSRHEHYRDWVHNVDVPLGNVASQDADTHAEALEARHYRIHFHCWTREELTEQLRGLTERYQLPAEITLERANYHEQIVAITRKPEPPGR